MISYEEAFCAVWAAGDLVVPVGYVGCSPIVRGQWRIDHSQDFPHVLEADNHPMVGDAETFVTFIERVACGPGGNGWPRHTQRPTSSRMVRR